VKHEEGEFGMWTITGNFKVDADGNVVVRVGIEHAGEEVEVVVRPLCDAAALERDESEHAQAEGELT
jgi:hypothetical protein